MKNEETILKIAKMQESIQRYEKLLKQYWFNDEIADKLRQQIELLELQQFEVEMGVF